jgi:hypothetical protein
VKHAKQAAQQEAEAAAKRAELAAAAADPWLNEDPNQASSSLSPARVSQLTPANGLGATRVALNNSMQEQVHRVGVC